MTIQTETAIVPFQGIIKPVRNIDHRILRYSTGGKYPNSELPIMDDGTDNAGITYGRYGRESASGCSLGENIDIYI